jgi:hypothetical protein
MVARVVYEVAAVIRHTSKIGTDPQGGQAAGPSDERCPQRMALAEDEQRRDP